MKSLAAALLLLLLLAGAPITWAQGDTGAPPDPPIFPILFPQPTSDNGHEEFARAFDLAHGSALLHVAKRKSATLSDKRRALADPDCVRALALLRLGLSKPTRAAGRGGSTAGIAEAIGPYVAFEALLRLEQNVLFADGKTGLAIDALRDGLRLGNVFKRDGLLGFGLLNTFGTELDRMVFHEFQLHLDQLSARDCDRLLGVVRVHLAAPDPAVALLETERAAQRETVEDLRQNGGLLASRLRKARESPETAFVRTALASGQDLGERGALADELTRRIDAFFDAQIARARAPSRPTAPLPDSSSVTGRLAAFLLQDQGKFHDTFAVHRAAVQLLGVHAALRRFRWEHNRLPPTLAEMELGTLALDPFTGGPLGYKITSPMTYELTNAGPLQINKDGTVTPAEKKTNP